MSRLYLLFDFTTLIIMHLQDPFNVGCCRFKNVNSRWEEHKQDIDLLAKHLCQALPESLTWSQCLATRIANFLALSIAEKLSRTSTVGVGCSQPLEVSQGWRDEERVVEYRLCYSVCRGLGYRRTPPNPCSRGTRSQKCTVGRTRESCQGTALYYITVALACASEATASASR